MYTNIYTYIGVYTYDIRNITFFFTITYKVLCIFNMASLLSVTLTIYLCSNVYNVLYITVTGILFFFYNIIYYESHSIVFFSTEKNEYKEFYDEELLFSTITLNEKKKKYIYIYIYIY